MLRVVIPVSAAMLALTGALAAACFVKVYGIAFLGQARTRRAARAREAGVGMVAAQGLLAGLCLLFGVFPTFTVIALAPVTESLVGQAPAAAASQGWMWLTPVSPEVASYSAPLVLVGVALAVAAWALVRWYTRRRRCDLPIPRREPWECGFGTPTARMQYSATAFSMPIREIFRPLFRLHEEQVREMEPALATRPARLRYEVHAEDLAWGWLYQPVVRVVHGAARRVTRIQTGRLRHYLAYSLLTIVLLLWVIT
ncbi:hypothetical protein [Inmirania thermothiophila]|uniref:hypothetical protein n=1 Tax=Inmirania thermothiophila TaxID=1750597 RepID=UPI001FE59CB3|nr:hypothetical protein [Inmirania thermothiophila]